MVKLSPCSVRELSKYGAPPVMRRFSDLGALEDHLQRSQ